MCSSHRSIFSRESMPPPSDSATHRPISGQSALILSSSQELFFLALFGSHDKSERTQLAAETDLSRVLCYGHSTGKTFTEEHAATSHTHTHTHTEEPALRSVTRATCYSDTPPTNSRTNILTGDTKKNLFSLWLVYFCYYNKPFVVVFVKELSLFICILN